jgi:hypothetical protein
MKRKLNNLVQRKTERTSPSMEPKHTFALRTENPSQIQFTEDEKKLLGKRIKYNQSENLIQRKTQDLAISCQQVIQRITRDLKHEFKFGKFYWTSRKIRAGGDRESRISSRESPDSESRSKKRTLSSPRLMIMMREHEKSKVNGGDKSWFSKHYN